jgi:hypothetical protein
MGKSIQTVRIRHVDGGAVTYDRGYNGGATEDVFENPEALKQLVVHDSDGRRIGDVEQVYVDDWNRGR